MVAGAVLTLLSLIIAIGLYYGGFGDVLDTMGATRSVERGRIAGKFLTEAHWATPTFPDSGNTLLAPVCVRVPEQAMVRIQLACMCDEHSYLTVVPRYLFDQISDGDDVDVTVRFGRFRKKLHFFSFAPRQKNGGTRS